MPESRSQAFLDACPDKDMAALLNTWSLHAKPHQIAGSDDWLIWLLLGGRGAGKTRTGAEWVREQVLHNGKSRIALVAPTYQDAREVMIEGESGLRNIGYPSERPDYAVSRRRLIWPNGAVGMCSQVKTQMGYAARNLVVLGRMSFALGLILRRRSLIYV